MHTVVGALALVLVTSAGCVEEEPVFECSGNGMCTRRGVAGTCEANHYCSFTDDDCGTRRRYSEHAGGEVAGTCVPEACPGNLIANPGFDSGTSGWVGIHATLSLMPGRSGNALQACTTGSDSYFNASDMPSTVLQPAQGTKYRLSLWSRTETPGSPSYAAVREIGPTSYVDDTTTRYTASADWQEVVVDYTVVRADSIELEVFAGWDDMPANACLQFDDLCLVEVP